MYDYKITALFNTDVEQYAYKDACLSLGKEIVALYIPVTFKEKKALLICMDYFSNAMSFQGTRGLASFNEKGFYILYDQEIQRGQNGNILLTPRVALKSAHKITSDNIAFQMEVLGTLSENSPITKGCSLDVPNLSSAFTHYKFSDDANRLIEVKVEKLVDNTILAEDYEDNDDIGSDW